MRVRSLCRALLALDLVYCAAAMFVPGLPAWRMFESSERSLYELHSGTGERIDLRVWVPGSARDLDDADVIRVARWLCAAHGELAPIALDTAQLHRTVAAPDCVDRATP